MAALDFPSSPTVGQTYTANGVTWTWDGTVWVNSTALAVASGGTGQTSYTNGQLLIGNTTGNTLTKATLTQGTGITITNGSGAITVANAGVVSFSGGSTGLLPSAATTGAVSLSGTLAVANGGTGVTTSTGTGSVVLSASPTLTGTLTTATADLLGSVRGNVTAVAASTIDCSVGNYFTKTAAGGLTWTFSNAPATRSFSFLLELTNGGTGTQVWPASVKWPGGTAPTLTTSGVDVLGFITDDSGTTWRGVMLMKDSK